MMEPAPYDWRFCIPTARAEWAFFRLGGARHRSMRRLWARHYARLRGWSQQGPILIDP
jgi:hypothetical protein